MRTDMQTASSALRAEQAAHPQDHGDVVCAARPGINLAQNSPLARTTSEAANVGIATLEPSALAIQNELLLESLGRRQPADDSKASVAKTIVSTWSCACPLQCFLCTHCFVGVGFRLCCSIGGSCRDVCREERVSRWRCSMCPPGRNSHEPAHFGAAFA